MLPEEEEQVHHRSIHLENRKPGSGESRVWWWMSGPSTLEAEAGGSRVQGQAGL